VIGERFPQRTPWGQMSLTRLACPDHFAERLGQLGVFRQPRRPCSHEPRVVREREAFARSDHRRVLSRDHARGDAGVAVERARRLGGTERVLRGDVVTIVVLSERGVAAHGKGSETKRPSLLDAEPARGVETMPFEYLLCGLAAFIHLGGNTRVLLQADPFHRLRRDRLVAGEAGQARCGSGGGSGHRCAGRTADYHGQSMTENGVGGGAPPASADSDAPKLSLTQHAEISAQLAEGTRPQREVLNEPELSEAEWNHATQFWMLRIAEDTQTHGAAATLGILYSDAFAKAQDGLKGVIEMAPEQWATLSVEIQQQGPARPLARRNLSNSDYIRLARHFARVLSSDPRAHDRYWQTYQALIAPQTE
jgi:hypothetical protein